MAIKFVDKEPEDGKPKKGEASDAKPQVHPQRLEGLLPLSEEAPELPLPKPVPKPRGRKKPLR